MRGRRRRGLTYVLFGLLAGLPALAAAQPALAFRSHSYAVGDTPFFVAVGDFNDDGRRDLAVANQGPFDPEGHGPNDSVSILLGRRDGRFRSAVNYPVGNGPTAIAVG
ncbi:MAG: hypothetical protein QOJ29_613, partial [Thermoleophilaceae bacterium]|nr:hypothetical protein [Thermoleophilaceae bacterium]